jgi:hypothetical protein
MQRFDKFNNEQNGSSEPSEPLPTVEDGTKASNDDTSDVSNHKRSPDDDESALSELEDIAPPKKKAKKSKVRDEDDDAAFAARLQAEENARMGRATRGGNTKRKAPAPKKKTKKKSATRVKDDDDSDVNSGSGAEKKSPSRKGGFHVCHPLQSPYTSMCTSANITTRNQWPSPLPSPPSSAKPNSRVPKPLRRYGSMSKRATCKTRATSARSAATTRCVRCSSRTAYTCLP